MADVLIANPPAPPAVSITYEPPIALRRFANVLLSEDVKGNKSEVERRTGIDRERFNYTMKHSPEFRAWFSEQCDQVLGGNEAIPTYSLLSQIVKGDVQAIRTYYELRRKLKGPTPVPLPPDEQRPILVVAFGETPPQITVNPTLSPAMDTLADNGR